MKLNPSMFQLVEALNYHNSDDIKNPIEVSQDWDFTFTVGELFSEIGLFGKTLVQGDHSEPINRKDFLLEIKDELESWYSSIESALWSVDKLLEKEIAKY